MYTLFGNSSYVMSHSKRPLSPSSVCRHATTQQWDGRPLITSNRLPKQISHQNFHKISAAVNFTLPVIYLLGLALKRSSTKISAPQSFLCRIHLWRENGWSFWLIKHNTHQLLTKSIVIFSSCYYKKRTLSSSSKCKLNVNIFQLAHYLFKWSIL